jgi:hypothetical protein
MPMPATYKDIFINMLPNTVYAALHSADVPTSINEITASGRKAITLGNSSGGAALRQLTGTTPLCQWDVLAGTTVRSVAYWSAATNGDIIWYYNVADETFAQAGKADLNSGSVGLGDISG